MRIRAFFSDLATVLGWYATVGERRLIVDDNTGEHEEIADFECLTLEDAKILCGLEHGVAGRMMTWMR